MNRQGIFTTGKCCCPEAPSSANTHANCVRREFRDNSCKLRCILGSADAIIAPCITPTKVNAEEIRYKNFNYNGSFHKGLQHNLRDGRLVSNIDYENFRDSVINDNQALLASIPLAIGSQIKLVNPLASDATILIGAPQCELRIDSPPALSTNQYAAFILEVYAQAIARDVPFINYPTDPIIAQLLLSDRLNDPVLLENLLYKPPGAFTPQTIFRGNTFGELMGPYISQLFLLDVPEGALIVKQLYKVPPDRTFAKINGFRVDWGVTLAETIDIQNGNLNLLPPPTPANQLISRYIYDGRSLAEAVHNDPLYQLFYQAALILLALGAQPNSGLPIYPNQIGFITDFGSPTIICAIADITAYALKHAWYWKFQHYRKLRPEVAALWVNDVKTGLVSNAGNFDLTNLLLNNAIVGDIFNLNDFISSGANSFTLPLSYREGSPAHPSYPSGHAVMAGASATVLKIFFNAEQTWKSLPGVIAGSLSGIAGSLVQADAIGTNLIPYTGADASTITIAGEIDKLASNISNGRDWAGIHTRGDWLQGMSLGEQVAIYYMQDILSTWVENNLNSNSPPMITFRKFDGTLMTIKPSVCRSI